MIERKRDRSHSYPAGLLAATAALLMGLTAAGVRAQESDAGAELLPEWTYDLTEVLPEDPAVLTGQLDNGLRYYVRKNGRPENRAFLRLVVRAGSVLEDDDQLGLAHFVEHMAFNGTKNFEKAELLDYLQSIGMRFGADVNAYTSFDETVYMLEVPTDDPDILDKALLVLEDWAGAVTLDDEEVELERGVVIEEWRGGRGAGARLLDAEIPYRFHGSRYAERLPIGDPEMLREVPPQRLRDFYRDWYRPDLMAVVAVGDFDAEAMEASIRRRFAALEGPDEPRERFETEIPPHEETLVSIFTDPELTRSSISVAFKGEADEFVTVADYRERLVRGLYNGLLNNRLAERAEEADPPFIGATSSRGTLARTRSLYLLRAGAREGAEVRALEALLTESERARRHGFEESELERARVNTLRSMDRAYDERDKTHSAAYAGEYVRNFLSDEPFPGIAYERELARRYVPGIALAEVNRVADGWIHDEDRVILASGPQKEGLEPPVEEELLAVFDRVGELEVAAYEDDVGEGALVPVPPTPGRIVERLAIEELGVTEWRLSNGVRVVLRPSDFKNDEVLFASFSPGGVSLVSNDDWLEANLATSVVQLSGLGNFSLTQLNKALAGKVASAGPIIGPLFEGINGRGSPKDLQTLFELIYLSGTSPRRDAEAYESFLTRQGALLRNQSAMPQYTFLKTFVEILSQNHPRRRMITEEMLGDLDQDRIFAVYEDRFRDFSDFTFFFAGSFELEAIEPLIETWLGGLPSTGREEVWRDVGVRTPKGLIERTVYKGLEDQSQIALVFNGPFEQSQLNRYRLNSMVSLLRDRLRERLREELGGTYGANVSGGADRIPVSEFSVQILFGCDPARVEEMLQAVQEEIEGLRTELATAEEVGQIQEQQRRSRETAKETNGFWLGVLQTVYQFDEDPLSILAYEELFEELDAEMIRGAAVDYLGGENRVQVLLLPEAAEERDDSAGEEAAEPAAAREAA
ncbi:MAG: insulinase family protein [Acidobacteria bacterium]|nr:insulinase family protein [Acidobacteriota bacterium]